MDRTCGISFLFILIFVCVLEASSIDPGHDGYIINCYLDNVKSDIRRQIGDDGHLVLPDFDFHTDKFFGFSGRRGSFENVAEIYRVDDATLILFGDVTNINAKFYLPNAQIHYEITMFGRMKINLDVRVLLNAIDINVNYTKSANLCSIQHNPDSVYISKIEGSTVDIYIDILHNQFIPAAVAEYVESAYESVIQLFVDTGLIFFVREGLTAYVYHLLVTAASNMDVCDIFDGQAQCGSLTR